MRKMKDMPLQDRPREKIAKRGAAALSDNELIEAIIGRGTRTKDVRMISQEICGILRDRRQGIRYEGPVRHRGDRSREGIPDPGLLRNGEALL